MMCWEKAQISKHPVMIVKSVYTLQYLSSYSKVRVIYSWRVMRSSNGMWNLFLPDNFLYCVMCISGNKVLIQWFCKLLVSEFVHSNRSNFAVRFIQLSHLFNHTNFGFLFAVCKITTDGLWDPNEKWALIIFIKKHCTHEYWLMLN